MLSRSSPSFVCRRSLARAPPCPWTQTVARSGPSTRVAAHGSLCLRHVLRRWATTANPPSAIGFLAGNSRPNAQPKQGGPTYEAENLNHLPSRERLRQWDLVNGQVATQDLPNDLSAYGSIMNTMSRTQATGSSAMDMLRTDDTDDIHGFGGDDIGTHDGGAALGLDSRNPGDLVELRRYVSRIPLLAVYLGFFSGCNHFYASNGRWIMSSGFSFVFTVSNFATLAELKPVLANIPKDATLEDLETLRQNYGGPSREHGAALLQKMAEFRTRAETIYRANVSSLEEAPTLLANANKPRYLSLSEIADAVLSRSYKNRDPFPPSSLYAVHSALDRHEVGFRLLNVSTDCQSPDNLVEIFPRNYAVIINNVVAMVREYSQACARYARPLGPNDLDKMYFGQFVAEARLAVLESRKKRQWTQHGILEASDGVELSETKWSESSMDVISYLEWWASYNLFDLGSRLHATGAIILRAIGLYDDVVLDQRTAWTFLQEIGRIAPWEIPSRYKLRLPGVTIERGGGLNRENSPDLAASRRPDVAAEVRHQRIGGETAFCIDAPSTTVIDDGISLERTEAADEFWVHIHAADPASVIKPDSSLCKFMELIPENIYLPGHFQAMIPSGLGEEDTGDYRSEGLVKEFSLRPNGPALTFSAKVNSAGEMLDYKIQPGTLGQVLYLDPEDVSKFCNEPRPPAPVEDGQILVAGKPPVQAPLAPERPMVAVEDLTEKAKDDLLTLSRLAEASRQQRLAKGAWPHFSPRPAVSVRFDTTEETAKAPGSTMTIPSDPYIEVKKEASTGCSVVSNLMVLAGEIAARWCASRAIPIPYRRDIKPAHNRQAALEYVFNDVYPLIRRGIEPPWPKRQELFNMTGGVQLSAEPGPYFLLGLDMYAKATSPLRRFSDLLVHWQIHAALDFERSKHRRIEPATDKVGDIVPFKGDEFKLSLRMLQMREKKARRMSRGILDWILIALVRSWRFEGRTPPALRFTVGQRVQGSLRGRLDLFDLEATLDCAGLDGSRLMDDVRVGDQFEVELADVNVYARQILLRATRYLGQPAQDKAGPASGPSAPLAPGQRWRDHARRRQERRRRQEGLAPVDLATEEAALA